MSDLKEIEKMLRKRLDELRERTDEIEDDLGSQGDDDFAEMAIESAGDEVLAGTSRAAEQEIGQIIKALDRIKSGDYGRCQGCGCEIAKERLEAVPYTSYCIKCAEVSSDE